MNSPLAYGIDYGTTNSSISVAYPHRVEVLRLGIDAGMPTSVPSITYLHRDGLRMAGDRAVEQFTVTGDQRTSCEHCALVVRERHGRRGWKWGSDCRQYERGGGCLDSRLMGELKSEFANDLFRSTHSWSIDFTMEQLAAIGIRDLKRRADGLTGQNVTRVVIGHPVAFFGTAEEGFEELQQLAEDRLKEAAHEAGFLEVELYPEPAAAALDTVIPDGYAVAVDFGGGTFDIAVVEVDGQEGEVVSMEGARIGGSIFDRLIYRDKVAPSLGLDHPSIPTWFRDSLGSWSGFRSLMTNRHTFYVLNQLRRLNPRSGALVDAIVRGGQAHPFHKAIERAKIRLSERSMTSIEFHPPQGDLSIPLNRTDLDRLTEPYLRTIRNQMLKALDKVGIGPDQVTAVFRTGGSSRLFTFAAMLERIFGADKIRDREPFTTVAQGLGVVAQEIWT